MAQAATQKRGGNKAGLIKMIHIANRALGLDEDTRRNLYESATGKRGLTEMNLKELWQVVERQKKCGFAPTGAVSQGVTLCDEPQAKKIRSLWLQLHEAGAVRDSSESALLKYVKRITGSDRMEWLNTFQFNRVIESLKSWLGRI